MSIYSEQQAITVSLLSAVTLYRDGNPRPLQLWADKILSNISALNDSRKLINQLRDELQEIQQELANTRSHYEGEYGNGYDDGKVSASEAIAELLAKSNLDTKI